MEVEGIGRLYKGWGIPGVLSLERDGCVDVSSDLCKNGMSIKPAGHKKYIKYIKI